MCSLKAPADFTGRGRREQALRPHTYLHGAEAQGVEQAGGRGAPGHAVNSRGQPGNSCNTNTHSLTINTREKTRW